MSSSPSAVRYFMRLREARLHAVSSRNMYSLHGFDELIGAVFEQVCQLLIVEWNCTPGSPQTHADSAISFMTSRAWSFSMTCPSRTDFVVHSRPSVTARMNSSVTRTEWFAF